MLWVIEALSRLWAGNAEHVKRHTALDRTIRALGESDAKLESRLADLRDQVNVIRRTAGDQDAPDP